MRNVSNDVYELTHSGIRGYWLGEGKDNAQIGFGFSDCCTGDHRRFR